MRTHRRLLRYLLHVYLNMEPFWSLLKYAFRMVGGGGGGGGNLEDLLPSWQQEFFLFIYFVSKATNSRSKVEMKFTSSWIPEPHKVIFMSTSMQSHLSLLSPWISGGFLCRWNDCILPYISWRMWFWHGTRDFFHSDKARVPHAFRVLALECGIFQHEHNLLHIGSWFIDNRILTPDRPFKKECPRVGPSKSESTNWTTNAMRQNFQ